MECGRSRRLRRIDPHITSGPGGGIKCLPIWVGAGVQQTVYYCQSVLHRGGGRLLAGPPPNERSAAFRP